MTDRRQFIKLAATGVIIPVFGNFDRLWASDEKKVLTLTEEANESIDLQWSSTDTMI